MAQKLASWGTRIVSKTSTGTVGMKQTSVSFLQCAILPY